MCARIIKTVSSIKDADQQRYALYERKLFLRACMILYTKQAIPQDISSLGKLIDFTRSIFAPFFNKQTPFHVQATKEELDDLIVSILSLPKVHHYDAGKKGKGLQAGEAIKAGTVVCFGDFEHSTEERFGDTNDSIFTLDNGELVSTKNTTVFTSRRKYEYGQ